MNLKQDKKNSAGRCNWKLSSALSSLALYIALGAATLQAQEWTPSERLLNLVRKIESADGLMLVGDHGNSRGAYQMSAGAWADVNAWRRARNLAGYDYATSVWNESVSRVYAANYLQMLHDRVVKSLGRTPSCGEVYAAYNMGFRAFARCQFSLAHVNSLTAANCRFIDSVMRQAEPDKDPESPVTLALASK
jgi:hypothetical protein